MQKVFSFAEKIVQNLLQTDLNLKVQWRLEMNSTPEIISFLGRLEIFSAFAEDTPENIRLRERICSILTEENFAKNEMIIHEGEVGEKLYMLLEGTVQVIRSTMHNEQFAVKNLSADQHIFFGEVALIDKQERSASVKALSECKTLVLSACDFHTLCEAEPVLGHKAVYQIACRLAASLRESTKDVLTLYQALLEEIGDPQ